MNGRTLLALVVAPVACALAFALWFVMAAAADPARASFAILLLPGLTAGTVFEIFALLPLLYWLRQRGSLSRGRFIVIGLLLWAVAASLQVWITAEVPFLHAIAVLPMLMIPGLALVIVFAFAISYMPAA